MRPTKNERHERSGERPTGDPEAQSHPASPAPVFPGASDMAWRCRTLDWAATPLGQVDDWPTSLRTAAGLVLGAAVPMILLWGPDLVQVYNDGYVPFLAAKHPAGLGRPTREVWPEVWHLNAPIYARVRAGETVALEEAHFPVTRQGPGGPAEDLYITLAYSPVPDDAGCVGGVLITLQDVTAQVAGRRAEAERARLARALAGAQTGLLEQLFEQAPTFLHVLRGASLVVELANPAYYQLVGHRELLGRPVFEAMPEAAAGGFPERIARVLATGAPFEGRELPVMLARAPGAPPEERLIDIVYLRLADGEPGSDGGGDGEPRVLGYGIDVTDHVRARRRAEAALAERTAAAEAAHADADLARGRLEVLLAHLPVGVTLAEAPSGRLLLSNPAVERIWGLDTPAARVAEYSALYVGFRPGPGPEAARQYASDEWPLARALATGEPVADERIEILRPDATRVLARVSAAPVRDAGGAVVGGVVLTQDVTERERLLDAEREARARTERLQALTAALAGARTIDEVATVVVADLVTALGARTGALAGRTPEGDALVLLRAVGFPEPVAASTRRQTLDLRTPLTECFRTQAPVWIESREGPEGLDARFPPIAPVWDALGVGSAVFVPLAAAGETIGVISFAFEGGRTFAPPERAFLLAVGRQAALAVERARLFDAEHAARTEAEAANRAKSEFLAVMSHELRTPLNAIGGYAELMEMGIRGPITAQQREDLRRIQASQRHLLGLINEVLNYAKLETGAVQFEVTTVRVRDALAGAEALVAPQAHAKGLALDIAACAPDLGVRADAEKLRQVLVNLLSNAVKFTPAGGRLALACAASDGRVAIMVRDSGIGIAADQLERIFEPFVQVRSDFTRTAEGTGLGLAISRDLSRGMGGDLTVESTLGGGSTFTLTLPVVS